MLYLISDLTLVMQVQLDVFEGAITIMIMSCPWLIPSIALLVINLDMPEQVDIALPFMCKHCNISLI